MKKLAMVALLAICPLILTSCATTGTQFKTVDYLEYKTTTPEQTKGGVTMSCQPLSRANMSDYPELFSFENTFLPEGWRMHSNHYFEKDANNKRWAYTFGVGKRNLTVTKVTVDNGTDHILRMGDARIYLRIEGYDPIKPYTVLGSTALIPTMVGDKQQNLPSAYSNSEGLVGWVTNAEMEFDANRKKGLIEIFHYPVGLRSQVIAANRRAYKLISDVDLEILPGDTYTGLLLFPAEVIKTAATIKFYDITVKTDAAGNPSEKVTFDFPLDSNHVQKWFNEIEKKWMDGTPPQPAK
jgi:hypothetical protein